MNRKVQLTHWVKSMHEGQIIKCTGEPYFNHLLAVAEMAAPASPFGYEVGLCHDLLEKTLTSQNELHHALIRFGYQAKEASGIVSQVVELTDVFTKAAYPHLKKTIRKAKEEERLATISVGAQTVKYADLVYNIGWVVEFDSAHAARYLEKKKKLLAAMHSGDQALHAKALQMISDAQIME
jgi:(p)ppGpp synthase/HD superfamily hydrolase